MSADEISAAEDEPVLIEWRGVHDGNGSGGLNEDTALRARSERPSRRAVEQLRIVLAEVLPDDPSGKHKLRRIAEKLVEAALDGQSWAIQQVADRIDGKPAQESTVNIKEKREASD